MKAISIFSRTCGAININPQVIFACLEDKWGDVVRSEKMCGTIIKVAVMAVKEDDLGVDLDSYTGPTEETYCLHLATPVHIYQRRVVD